VFDLYGQATVESLRQNSFAVSYCLMGDGERFKSLDTFEKALDFLARSRLERGDAVLALGGGVVGDLAGFAAAVYLRGIALVQVPTTLLAQIDSSVGGKTGINLPLGKNLVGAFRQPRVVIIDTKTLTTLSERDLTSGWCEAVKNGATGRRSLFHQTVRFLSKLREKPTTLQSPELESLVSSQCAFKAAIVARDPYEELHRTDRLSRRILNFGHTVGHAIEAATGYRRFKHGEAVGYGMLVAGEISKSLGVLEPSELELLREAISFCGPLPRTGDLDVQTILDATGRDKKTMDRHVQWVLLEKIGKARIVDGREVKPQVLRASLRAVLRNKN
jgi:3-dehydroquinate synthase